MNIRSLISTLGLTAALLVGGVACSAEDQANDALKDAGIDANVSTGGDLPDGFPSDVPTPDLDLETGAGVAGTYTLRYTSSDSAGDPADYRTALAGEEFTISNDFTFDKASGDYTGFTATGKGFQIVVSAYGPDAPGGGDYMAVVVTKA